MQQLGNNVAVSIDGDTLTIVIDLAKRGGRSKSGKTTIIASTEGNQKLDHPSGAVIGFNCYVRE